MGIAAYEKVRAEFDVILANEDIDCIMAFGLECGSLHWCDEAVPVGDYLGEYASEQISRGGQLKLHDFEGENELILTREKFIGGFKKYLAMPAGIGILGFAGHELRVKPGYIDAGAADSIIQYALFGDVIYG